MTKEWPPTSISSAGLEIETLEEIRRHDRRPGVEQLGEGAGRLEPELAVERIGSVDGP